MIFTSGFLLAAPVLAFAWDGPLYIKVIGICGGVSALGYLWVVLRAFIEIREQSVTMRGARGPVLTFEAGDTTVKITEATTGLLSVTPVVTLRRHSDGRWAALPLVSFSRAARADLPTKIRSALRVTHEKMPESP